MMQDLHPTGPNDSMAGKLLVASTLVDDPVLHRAVCLIVHHDADQVFGVLLNRPMVPHPALAKMISQQDADTNPQGRSGSRLSPSETTQPGEVPGTDIQPPVSAGTDGAIDNPVASASQTLGTIHFGGPLSGPVVAIHNASEFAEAEAGQGVYVAAQRDLLENLVKRKPSSFRLIVGHLGWSTEQLKAECDAGLWHVLDATGDDILIGDQQLWPSVIRRATDRSVAAWLGLKQTPVSAEWN
ncbi:YqgE/AlgH family protein [Roseiconus nitratireducens]|uniref:YqgE/AlgH family protein n=1 Tax=Roseiconus nitratireducens TaxID=2605748 RepID=A0A5M6D1X4_9BACT|nr:YqgE/AlgH family protein [Roseiconus nitratireducens]KAA5541006.1 YqgE/AlgH family protein [Roseiconus nitratireducens]